MTFLRVACCGLLIGCSTRGTGPAELAPDPVKPAAPVDPVASASAPVLPPGHVAIPVAVSELGPGVTIAADHLMWTALPSDQVARHVVTGFDDIVGRVVTEPILAFEPIRAERLAAEPAGTPIPDGVTLNTGRIFSGEVPQGKAVMVLVAARDLAPGAAIAESDLYAVETLTAYLAEGVFLSPEHVVGRTVCTRMLANEFVRAGRLDVGGRCP